MVGTIRNYRAGPPPATARTRQRPALPGTADAARSRTALPVGPLVDACLRPRPPTAQEKVDLARAAVAELCPRGALEADDDVARERGRALGLEAPRGVFTEASSAGRLSPGDGADEAESVGGAPEVASLATSVRTDGEGPDVMPSTLAYLYRLPKQLGRPVGEARPPRTLRQAAATAGAAPRSTWTPRARPTPAPPGRRGSTASSSGGPAGGAGVVTTAVTTALGSAVRGMRRLGPGRGVSDAPDGFARPAKVATVAEGGLVGMFEASLSVPAERREQLLKPRVPPSFWLTEKLPVPGSTGAVATKTADGAVKTFDTVTFPLAAPRSRDESYHLASVLDAMVAGGVPDLAALTDPAACFGPASTARDAYHRAASAFVSVCDTGLAEVARHCVGGCAEYGGLLDALRGALVDVARNALDLAAAADPGVAPCCERCLALEEPGEERAPEQMAAELRLVEEQCRRLRAQVREQDEDLALLRDMVDEGEFLKAREATRKVLSDLGAERGEHASVADAVVARFGNVDQEVPIALPVSAADTAHPSALPPAVGGEAQGVQASAAGVTVGAAAGSTTAESTTQDNLPVSVGRATNSSVSTGARQASAARGGTQTTVKPKPEPEPQGSVSPGPPEVAASPAVHAPRPASRQGLLPGSTPDGDDDRTSAAHPVVLAAPPGPPGAQGGGAAAFDEEGAQRLYEAMIRYLSTMRALVGSTDSLCRPFHSKMALNRPELRATVATTKWAAVAAAVGRFELSPASHVANDDGPLEADVKLRRYLAAQRTAGHVGPPPLRAEDVGDLLTETAGTMEEMHTRLQALAASPDFTQRFVPPPLPPQDPDMPCPLCHRLDAVPTRRDKKRDVLEDSVVELVAQPLRAELEAARANVGQQEAVTAKLRAKVNELRTQLQDLARDREADAAAPRLASSGVSGRVSPALSERRGRGGTPERRPSSPGAALTVTPKKANLSRAFTPAGKLPSTKRGLSFLHSPRRGSETVVPPSRIGRVDLDQAAAGQTDVDTQHQEEEAAAPPLVLSLNIVCRCCRAGYSDKEEALGENGGGDKAAPPSTSSSSDEAPLRSLNSTKRRARRQTQRGTDRQGKGQGTPGRDTQGNPRGRRSVASPDRSRSASPRKPRSSPRRSGAGTLTSRAGSQLQGLSRKQSALQRAGIDLDAMALPNTDDSRLFANDGEAANRSGRGTPLGDHTPGSPGSPGHPGGGFLDGLGGIESVDSFVVGRRRGDSQRPDAHGPDTHGRHGQGAPGRLSIPQGGLAADFGSSGPQGSWPGGALRTFDVAVTPPGSSPLDAGAVATQQPPPGQYPSLDGRVQRTSRDGGSTSRSPGDSQRGPPRASFVDAAVPVGGAQRLLSVVRGAPDEARTAGASRTAPSVLKEMDHIYRAKLVSDLTCDHERRGRRTLGDFLLDSHFRNKHGEAPLVAGALAGLLAGCLAHEHDPRVQLFGRFVTEFYSAAVLHVFARLHRAIDDVTLAPAFTTSCGDDAAVPEPISLLTVHRALDAVGAGASGPEAALYGEVRARVDRWAAPLAEKAFTEACARGGVTASVRDSWSPAELEAARQAIPRVKVMAVTCELRRLCSSVPPPRSAVQRSSGTDAPRSLRPLSLTEFGVPKTPAEEPPIARPSTAAGPM